MAKNSVTLDAGWRIVIGATGSLVENTAARDLQTFLKRQLHLDIDVLSEDQSTGTSEIVVGTPETSGILGRACAARVLGITGGESGPESFQVRAVDGCILVCGADPVGALYGAVCLEDLITDRELKADLDVTRRPFFKERSCGAQWSQEKPARYKEEDLASWLAHHSFNLYGPIIQPWYGNNLSDEVAERYGIRSSVAVEPPRATVEFMQAHPESVEYDRRGAVQWGPSPTVCFRCEEARPVFSEWIKRVVRDNPRATQLTMYFGDLSCICSEQCPRCEPTPYPLRAIEVLEFLSQEARKVNPHVKLIGQTWILHGADEVRQIIEKMPPGLGVQMNEPALAEPAEGPGFGAQDVWLVTGELDGTFGPIYQEAGRSRGEDFYPLMGIGDTCESVDPVIGLPLPWLVARKIRRAAESGMQNLCVWWGIHPWIYTPSHDVVREMVFDPFQDVDALVRRVAARHFGETASEEVLETWRLVDQAFECWRPKVNWMERLEEYTGRCTRRAFFIPLTESIMEQEWSMKGQDWALSMSKSDKIDWWAYRNLDILIPVRTTMCGRLKAAVHHARVACEAATGEAQLKTRQQVHWLNLLYCLFLSQYHYFRSLEFEKNGMGEGKAIEEWMTVVEAEIENCENVLALVDAMGDEISNISGIGRTLFSDKLDLTLKIKQMKYHIRPENIKETLQHKARRMRDILSLCPVAPMP